MVLYTAIITFGISGIETEEDVKRAKIDIEQDLKGTASYGTISWSVRYLSKLTKKQKKCGSD